MLEEIHRWAKECSLEFSYDKCQYTVIPPKGKLGYIPSCPIKLNGHRVKWTNNLTYLGIVINSDRSWMPHLNSVWEKAHTVQGNISRLRRANWDLKPKLRKAVYLAIAERVVLYAAPVWYIDHKAINDRLLSIQRDLLLCVTKCYG